MKTDLTIAYRVYPKLSKPAPFGITDKLELTELCLRSLLEATDGLSVRVCLISNGCPDVYQQLLWNSFSSQIIDHVRFHGASTHRTRQAQIECLLRHGNSLALLVCEDDYLWLPGALRDMLELLGTGLADYVTPYDHPDGYSLGLQPARRKVIQNGRLHWQEAFSTTHTFMARPEILAQDASVFCGEGKFSCEDFVQWLCLTKRPLWSPALLRNWRALKYVAAAWCFSFLVAYRCRRRLWSPIPSLATHMVEGFVAPAVNWRQRILELWGKNAPWPWKNK